MRLGPFLALLVLLYLLFAYGRFLRTGWENLVSTLPRMRAMGEMAGIQEGLRGYMERYGDLPPDLYAWLNENYQTASKPNPGVDPFGSPYLCEWRGGAVLRSLGPDKLPYTRDDLIVVISPEPPPAP